MNKYGALALFGLFLASLPALDLIHRGFENPLIQLGRRASQWRPYRPAPLG